MRIQRTLHLTVHYTGAMSADHTAHHSRVSVIIPVHNRLETLKRAIQSVLAQSHPVHEIIVIDDGSDDGTGQWSLQQGAPLQPLIQQNHGVSHARNRGIERANGEWIALLDSDDFWHPDKLRLQLQRLTENPDCRLCHCDELWIRNGKRVNQHKKHRKQGGDIFEQCLAMCAISPSAAVMHRDIFATHGLFDESLPACEDYDLWLRITAHEPVAFVDQALLTKTGGHADQLSARYPVMDRFRLQALAGLLRRGSLDVQQRTLALQMFRRKLTIVRNGAQKRANAGLLAELARDYADLIDDGNSDVR